MIACIRGELFAKSDDRLIVMAGGVGYEVFATAGCLNALPETGHQVLIPVYTHVREDALLLYGFVDEAEKRIFHLLITVSGIGPRLALTILSGIAPAELAAAIRHEAVARLVQLPGVGKKTAERLCLELKDKVQWVPEALQPRPGMVESRQDQLWLDTISALINLGYPRSNAEEAVGRVVADADDPAALTLEKIVRQALRLLA
ncbi:MAG: Holliday junction branch migration protein RuvA [Desulfurivibrio sp.]|jgi:Holliday junction DNA helicase RuvA|nr:MAG: Holliday junction branch migration protein RuvA [Desulfurivibrio sp.]